MYLFAYGLVSIASQDNQMYTRMMRLITKKAWVLNAALYITPIELPALTFGKDKVMGKLFLAEDSAIKTFKEMAERFDQLNLPYKYSLNPIKVYTDKGDYKAYAFMYNSCEGLTKFDGVLWTK